MLRRAAGRIPHVCVVGAGVAGLRCADVLLQHGVRVTILEGRDRVGGRLCQSSALGHMVDLGPNWIHGTDDNPILDLAKETNTMTMTWDGRQSVFDHLGQQMPDKEAAENTEIVWEIIEQAMKYSNEESATIPADKSLYHYFEEKVAEMITDEMEGDEQVKRKRETILGMAEMWGAFVGTQIQSQSLKFFWLEECIDGENLFVAETYHKVLARIAEPALAGAEIKFGHKVKKLVSKGTNEEPCVEVELEGKSSMTFDEVVMTAPLGWLKTHGEAFEPELPNRLKQAIASIGYGHLDKVYITFPTAFWNSSSTTSPSSPSTHISHDPSLPNVTATTAPLHQPPPSTQPTVNPAHYPGFTHWTRPTYAHPTNPSHWAQEAMNLAALPPPNAHPTLLFYTYGPTSLHLATQLKPFPSPTCSPAAQQLLTTFFAPYFSRLPNYSASNPAHQPSRILATAWANDELAGCGSYANFQTGLERGGEDVQVMRRGVPERGVWLAGEHTAPFVALGTVTGAYWAGEGVARRIVRAYGGVEGSRGEERVHVGVNGSS
ncbi:FAD/NAD(P)-binding domain-containing protein [Trematosphaeria pertusa]|uniref:FAD/NAD(P)-binding domain-containing protein n=1 Tax=Trematosphaeria pertusa TaxID=390896 RepID=A0A6A6IMP1_9PLEO|nr:FAD/NAD(P)-binding domain-containing protein [Trematosphaeria pertusa]KAF2250840.1 FAD/NAD(P)-binding domain-containing protein [Trematosphaeria pertusa]